MIHTFREQPRSTKQTHRTFPCLPIRPLMVGRTIALMTQHVPLRNVQHELAKLAASHHTELSHMPKYGR